MNKLLLLLLVITINKDKPLAVFNFKDDMVWIEQAKLFVCKYEVTNKEYREFTDVLLKDSLDALSYEGIFNIYYPDTTVWLREFRSHMGDGMYKYYRWHSAFDAHPVVGVSYEGAVMYCEWLTAKYGNGEYRFRLPTEQEFIKYARVDPYTIAGGIASSRNDHNGYNMNFKPNYTNLDDSLHQVFYNPQNNTFIRLANDSLEAMYKNGKPGSYKSHVEAYLDGYLYIGAYKPFYTYKVQDSITFYNTADNSYVKEKMIVRTVSNYYSDGYMYTSPTRYCKDEQTRYAFENGEIRTDITPSVWIKNKSSYPADKNGLFDLAGNVSEMTSKKGSSMGANWNSELEALTYNYEYSYEVSSSLIGFRIVAERIK